MPLLLFGVGIFALVAGLVMIGFGIPINEFSFGNTLISAGTTAGIGGLIIIALGVAVGQLRRIAQAIDARPVEGFMRPMEAVEAAPAARAAPAQGRAAFPPRPKTEPYSADLDMSAALSAGAPDEEAFAPTLRNPDETPLTVEDEISLSPPHPQAVPMTAPPELGGMTRPGAGPPVTPEKGAGAAAGWRAPPMPPRPQPANFDAMWPSEPKPARGPGINEPKIEPKAEPKTDVMPREPVAAPTKRAEPEAQKPRAVAILKSGVVDGMGYTLYVDGSIEAELPQGTLRFASINELRSHLEKNS